MTHRDYRDQAGTDDAAMDPQPREDSEQDEQGLAEGSTEGRGELRG